MQRGTGLWLGLATLMLWPGIALSEEELRVDIRQGVISGIPVAVAAVGASSREVVEVVAADLSRSGMFLMKEHDLEDLKSLESRHFDAEQWSDTDAEYVIGAQLLKTGEDRIEVAYRVWDVLTGEALPGKRLAGPARLWRRLAHRVADSVHEGLTDVPGAFDTRLAYVRRAGRGRNLKYYLYISDVDGHNPVAILSSPEPLLSPEWSPDGKKLAYVSLERGRGQIYLQDIRQGTRRPLPRRGIASNAPAFSPDGRTMAMTINVKDNQEIFLCDLGTGELTRMTHHPGIDTEPAWEPDGQALVFTSDRDGNPRLYRQRLGEREPQLLPIRTRFSAAAAISANGRYVAFVQAAKGRYSVALHEPESGALYPLSSGRLDESPSFAPNSQSLIYSSMQENGEQVLIVSSYNGIIRQRLETVHNNIREPAWSPYR